MFCLNDTMRYYLCPGATDMRKGMNTLSGIVVNQMGQSLRFGDIFIFVNRKKDTVKFLSAEDGGLVLYIKKLCRGRFRLPEYKPGIKSFSMEWRDLVVMVEGIIENPDKRQRRVIAPR